MEIQKALACIMKAAFPDIKQDWSCCKTGEEHTLFEVSNWPAQLLDHVNDYFDLSLKSILTIIESSTTSQETSIIGKQLVVILADTLINRHSELPQCKPMFAYKLYKNKTLFRESVQLYSEHLHRLIANLVVYSFMELDQTVLSDICCNCFIAFRRDNKKLHLLVDQIDYEFENVRSFSLRVSGNNVRRYWTATQTLEELLPELNFGESEKGQLIKNILNDLVEIEALAPLQMNMEKEDYWTNTDELPEFLEFDYLYPNGSNGDILRYLLEEYGTTEMVSPISWHGNISKEYIHFFEILWIVVPYLSDDPKFAQIFSHHVPTIMQDKLNVFRSSAASRCPSYNKFQNTVTTHKRCQKQQRTELYSQLVQQKRTSPKWKSEAQLYGLVSTLYPDAVYQYHAGWLGMQSLDIFIPSISVGIEYQGRQHYEPIGYFGGESHFEHQQENDRKKRKLCKDKGITLIEWPYKEKITKENLDKYLQQSLNK